jgi:hypothetical protein
MASVLPWLFLCGLCVGMNWAAVGRREGGPFLGLGWLEWFGRRLRLRNRRLLRRTGDFLILNDG